jgi:hypothetical protein
MWEAQIGGSLSKFDNGQKPKTVTEKGLKQKELEAWIK